jgi:hypothetical protein
VQPELVQHNRRIVRADNTRQDFCRCVEHIQLPEFYECEKKCLRLATMHRATVQKRLSNGLGESKNVKNESLLPRNWLCLPTNLQRMYHFPD